MKRIKITTQDGQTLNLEVPDYMTVQDSKLVNTNTGYPEFVEGDVAAVPHICVIAERNMKMYQHEEVVGYSDFQILETRLGKYVLSAEDGRKKMGMWKSKVELIN